MFDFDFNEAHIEWMKNKIYNWKPSPKHPEIIFYKCLYPQCMQKRLFHISKYSQIHNADKYCKDHVHIFTINKVTKKIT